MYNTISHSGLALKIHIITSSLLRITIIIPIICVRMLYKGRNQPKTSISTMDSNAFDRKAIKA